MPCCFRPTPPGVHTPQPEGNGIVALAAHPDCPTPHSGEYRGEEIYIVGWKTEHEKLFRASDSKRAVIYRDATDRNLRISRVSASQLCDAAVLALYAD